MAANTASPSAICGTFFGLTKLAASSRLKPAATILSISASLFSVETMSGSFCNPSRGLTSTSSSFSLVTLHSEGRQRPTIMYSAGAQTKARHGADRARPERGKAGGVERYEAAAGEQGG